jgi:hypothetical protein
MSDLLTFLKTECRGKDRAVKVRNLALTFRLDQRELRDQLRQLNLSGEPIVSGRVESISPPSHRTSTNIGITSTLGC